MKTALVFVMSFAAFLLGAFDRGKTAQELENISLKTPGKIVRRSFDIVKNTPYSISSLALSSHDDIAWFEVRLFEKGKDSKFFRSIRTRKNQTRLSVVFNSETAERAEVSFVLMPDAMPQSSADFKEFRFVACEDITLQSWKRRGPSRCRREFRGTDIILYPIAAKNTGSLMTQIAQIIPDKKMRFSAEVTTKVPEAAAIYVICGGKGLKSEVYKSNWNKSLKETLTVDFDTKKYTWIGIELRCRNGKKFKNLPITFSNIKLTPRP